MGTTEFYREHLRQELAARCERNPRYSIRAFSRALEVDVASLSRVLSGKQIPSLKLSQKLADALGLAPEKRERFFFSVAEKQRYRNLERLNPVFRSIRPAKRVTDLSPELYRIFADWYHFAILELTFVEGFDPAPRWIARELGIGVAEASLAVERLLRFGLLRRRPDGRLVKTDEQLSSADKNITTPAHRKNQKQFLEKAIESLEKDSIDERNMSSMTMTIDPDKIPLAKQMIREFNRSLCQLLESGKRKRVYNLEIALYPIQRKRKPKKELSK